MEYSVSYNGTVLQEQNISIAPFTRALQYGDGVFETVRSYSGRFFRLERHVDRLFEGLTVLRIHGNFDATTIFNSISSLLQAQGLSDASVKIMAFREGCESPDPAPNASASLLISARTFDFVKKARYEKGITAHIVSTRRNTLSPIVYIKSMNYLENIIGRLEACDHNAHEALFLNIHGMLAEGATSNIFIISSGTLYTSPVQSGILRGITRDAVLQIASDSGISCSEKNISPEELSAADEAFCTNSLMEIMPLVAINGKPVGTAEPGMVTQHVMRSFRNLLEKELK